jgi:hypothetical protein
MGNCDPGRGLLQSPNTYSPFLNEIVLLYVLLWESLVKSSVKTPNGVAAGRFS